MRMIPELHVNQLGGYWVDLVEVSAQGKRVVETVGFTDRAEAGAFWAKKTKEAMRGVTK